MFILQILRFVKKNFIKRKKKLKWIKSNRHNFTQINTSNYNYLNIKNINVGKNTYGCINVECYGTNEKLRIGSYCSIGPNVIFLLGGNHYLDYISTYPFKTLLLNQPPESYSKGDIIIEDDVWFGRDCLIMSGVHISRGCVIGARSVVTKDIPPYSIVAGNPAKIIRQRFSEKVIEHLLKFDFDNLTIENIEQLYVKLNDDNIQDICANFESKIKDERKL